ncbi:MAG TPA: aspartate carbamoyltransferase catalytic subunit [Acidimicrobiia bacterium]
MSLFTIGDVDPEAIMGILDSATGYGRATDRRHFEGTIVATMFFEASTRTRLSFELAAARIGADVVSFDPETSSSTKGETLKDTARTICAMGVDVLVIRHSDVGAPEMVAEWTGCPVINGGDGRRGHPTQTLADLLTIRNHFGAFADIKIGLVGDIANSRVARGLIDVLPRLGVSLQLIGPPPFLTGQPGIPFSHTLDDVLPDLDVVYLLRVQKERGATRSYPSDREYRHRFGLTARRAELLKDDAVVMHPGPFNRGVEIDGPVADGDRSLILDQVANGVLVRMAVLASALEKKWG